jgi:hypothetical protein
LRIQEIEEEHATNGKVKDTKITELERLVYEKTAGEVKKGLRSDDAPPKKRGGRSRGGRNCELRSVYNGSYETGLLDCLPPSSPEGLLRLDVDPTVAD